MIMSNSSFQNTASFLHPSIYELSPIISVSSRMDPILAQASRAGNVTLLAELLRDNPNILDGVTLVPRVNPLHLACVGGHVEFVKQIVSLKPDFARERNPDGFSPMHIACACGHLEIVRVLLQQVGPTLCQLKGRDDWTPLHYAASRGRVDAIREMVQVCPEAIEDVTAQGETALHLAVKNSQFEAVRVLVELVREMNRETILNMTDTTGNSLLHLATWKKQRQVVEWLVGNGSGTPDARLELVNIKNGRDLKAVDVLLMFPSEAGDREIHQILLDAAGANSAASNHSTCLPVPVARSQRSGHGSLEYLKFKRDRDSPNDTRNALLVVFSLVATATFQAGISIPSELDNDDNISIDSFRSEALAIFHTVNTLGLLVSLWMINILTTNFPLRWLLQFCMVSMYVTYVIAATTSSTVYIFSLSLCITVGSPVLLLVIKCFCKCRRKFRRPLPTPTQYSP